MLQTIDILIGFTVVMLILSAIVTMLVQFVLTTVLNLRGVVLRTAVAQLLMTLDKEGLTWEEASAIATELLTNSLVGRKKLFANKWGLAGAIHREELVKLILDFASGADLTRADEISKGELQPSAGERHLRERLLNSLRNNGLVEPPEEVLRAVRGTMLALEQAHPGLSADVRQSMALLTHASSEFLAKLNAWFDQTIDRSVDSFATRARMWTVGVSALVALFFQVNTFELIQRLSVDHETRQALVAAAIDNPKQFEPLPAPVADPAGGGAQGALPPPCPPATGPAAPTQAGSPPAPVPVEPAAPSDEGAGQQQPEAISPAEALRRIRCNPELGRLVEAELITWPADFDTWWSNWTRAESGYQDFVFFLGVLLTIGLLSMGAPLWYEVLKNLLQLRSVVARKDDAQRTVRQTSQDPAAAPAGGGGGPAAAAPAPGAGERGDLEAAG